MYYTDNNGHYPQNLEVLKENGYFEVLPTCPYSDNKYLVQVDGWTSKDLTILCPNPESHENVKNKDKIIKLYFYIKNDILEDKNQGIYCLAETEDSIWKIIRITILSVVILSPILSLILIIILRFKKLANPIIGIILFILGLGILYISFNSQFPPYLFFHEILGALSALFTIITSVIIITWTNQDKKGDKDIC